MFVNYAIITFRSTGPIKSWAELGRAQVHNLREKPIGHAVEDSPPPYVIFGSNNLVDDVRKKLVDHGIDPNNLRENGVLAYEAVMTASPAFFTQWDEEDREKRLFEWVAAQTSFALNKYDKRVASMVLHRDEETPHVHMVIVPLELIDDKRRKDRGWRWSLVGSSISGPGRFDQLQDAYAEAMAPFGLVRGERGSGQKNEPYRVVMARVADREKAASDRETMALNAADAAEQQRRFWLAMSNDAAEQNDTLVRKLADVAAAEAEVERQRKALEEEARLVAAKAADVEAARLLNLKRSNELLQGWSEFNEEQTDLDNERAAVRAERGRQAGEGSILHDAIVRAEVFTAALVAIDRNTATPEVARALHAADQLTADRQPMAWSGRIGAAAPSAPQPPHGSDMLGL